jgi:hypothetical protein
VERDGAVGGRSRPGVPTARYAEPARRRRVIVGKTYLERGKPVKVLIRWGPGGGPRNVLIRREDGTLTVRPFRGLRRT